MGYRCRFLVESVVESKRPPNNGDEVRASVRWTVALLLLSLAGSGAVALSEAPTTDAPQQTLAPQYTLSDGFGVIGILIFATNGRYDFQWLSDTGPVARSLGRYVVEPHSVSLQPDSSDFRRDPRTFAEAMHRVRWGAREYLIAEERMLAFANAINAGREPRANGFGLFYLREGDEAKAVAGQPDLGPKWNPFLLKQPLSGAVVQVEQRETLTQRPVVIIDAGARAGLKQGMELYASNPRRPHFYADLTIIDVDDTSARAVVPLQYNHIRVCDLWKTERGAAQHSDADEQRVASCLRTARR